jgi:hypothetical protein
MKKLMFLAVGALGLLVGGVATSQSLFVDPARGPAPVDTAAMNAAKDALGTALFPADLEVVPTTVPPRPQILVGVGLQFSEVAPGVWFGIKARGPAWEGSALVRRVPAGGFASIEAPAPVALAGFDGSRLLVHTNVGLFASDATVAASGAPVWVKVADQAVSFMGTQGDYSLVVRAPGEDGTYGEEQLRDLVCVSSTCTAWVREDTPEYFEQAFWSFDGGRSWGKDIDGGEEPVSAGVDVVSAYFGGARVWNTPTPDRGWDGRHSDDVGGPGMSHWSSARSKMITVRDGSVLAWSTNGSLVPIATGLVGVVDAIETPDGKLVLLRKTTAGFEVVRDGVVVHAGALPPEGEAWFGAYAGGGFITVSSASHQAQTLASSYDSGLSWSESPTDITPFSAPQAPPTTTTSTTSTTSTSTTSTTSLLTTLPPTSTSRTTSTSSVPTSLPSTTIESCAFNGFDNPVDNAPVVNVVKAGAAVPVKFGFCQSGSLAIFVSGSPGSVSHACGTQATDDIELTVAVSTSGLTFDAATGRYQYNWKTDKAWTGQCRTLTLRFTNGATRTAEFRFR